ncbi:MAG: hypothetical protein HY721_19405, partial [Planctomycetes bacterium]|nr:hypothetical protein [Planctomycetota bacterium]
SLDGAGAQDPGRERAEASRELEAAYAELEKLLELERLQREVERYLEEILGGVLQDPRELEELREKQRRIEEELGEGHLSLEEVVELVARLVAIDRDGREVGGGERALAAEAERAAGGAAGPGSPGSAAGPGGPGGPEGAADLRALGPRQEEITRRAREVFKGFQAAGFKLSAVLPHVLRAYWKAGEAAEPALEAMEAAGAELAAGGKPQGKLLEAAGRIDAFLEGVGDMRRAALEAIADAERGGESSNAAHADLERARRDLRESAELLRQGQTEAAARAQVASRRSLADAAGSLRSRIAEVLLPSGEEGALMSRLLDEEAARLGLSWNVLTRGSFHPAAAALDAPAQEMPFPAAFRELVRVYLKALAGLGLGRRPR